MRPMFTRKLWVNMLAISFTLLLCYTTQAQRYAAKCPGFTAKITNGSVLNLCTGSTINLAAAPTTQGYTFQWQVQTTAGGPFTNISGATGSSQTISGLGAYRVIIGTGSCIDTSGITSVIRLTPQGGTITPATTTPICVGDAGGWINGTQVPGAVEGIITYGWERNENNAGWVTIPGASDVSFNVGNVNVTTSFRRLSMDNCGNRAYSNVATIRTVTTLNAGTVAPMSQTINRGEVPAAITSTAPASGGTTNYTYQWKSSFFERGPYSNISGATGLSYSPGALQETMYYIREAKDVRCFTTANTAPAVVLVRNGILNAGNFTIFSQCFFPGTPASAITTQNEPRGGVPPYTVQWQSSTNNSTWTDIPGANGSVYQPGVLSQSTWFRKKVTDAAGTVAYTVSELISMVTAPLTGGSIIATANVACLGSSPAIIKSATSPSGYNDLIYQWQYKNAGTGNQWVDIAGQIRDNLIPEPITEKTTFRRVAIDKCGNNTRTTPSNEVEIDIRPALIAGDIEPTSQMIRSGGTPRGLNSVADPSGGTGSYSVSWENAGIAVGPWSTIASATSNSYQPPSLTQTTYYRRIVMDNGCLATKYTYAVEVYFNTAPPVTGGTLGGSTCVFPGNRPGVLTTASPVTGGNAPFTYTWEMRPGTTGTWIAIAGATGESYQPPVISQTTQYRRKVTDRWGEFAYSTPFTVNYISTPLNPGSITIKSSVVVCAGSTPGLIESVSPMSGGGENPTYSWQMMEDGGSWTTITGATGANYQPGTINKRTSFRRGATDMCSGVTRTVYSNVVVFELPVKVDLKAGLVDGPFITCAGTAPGLIRSVLDACGANTGMSYQWEVLVNGTWQNISGATSASYSPGAISANTTYRRRAFDNCGNTGYSNSVEIFVYPPITAGVIGSETQTVCANAKPARIKLLTNCHYTDGTVSYQWQSSSRMSGPWTNVTGATTSELSPAASTTTMYYRLMVSSTTCSFVAYTNVATVFIAACKEADPGISRTENADMKVYPNPLTGNQIDVKVVTKGKVSVTMLNTQGRPVPVNVSNTGSGLMKVNFINKPSKGMYVLNVNDEKGSWTKKIIVQ